MKNENSSKFQNLENAHDVEAFIKGLTLFGTGGGGLPHRGRALLLEHIEAGKSISWSSSSDFLDDIWTCSVFGMGSIAPHSPLNTEERHNLGFGDPKFDRPGRRAVVELSSFLEIEFSAIVPFELGGFNTTVAIDAAIALGLPLVDGDYVGRATPELAQALPAIRGYRAWPLSICDNWGNALILKDSTSPAVAEQLGKMVSIVTKTPDITSTCAHAAFPIKGNEMKECIIPGTLTRSLQIGRKLMDAQDAGEDPIEVLRQSVNGWLLFRGTVIKKTWDDRDGYMTGITELAGYNKHEGKTGRVWFRNENHIFWLNDVPLAVSPDLIMIVSEASGEPRINTDIKEGDKIVVIGCKAHEHYRYGKPLQVTQPSHYGFDLPYQPIEKLTRV